MVLLFIAFSDNNKKDVKKMRVGEMKMV